MSEFEALYLYSMFTPAFMCCAFFNLNMVPIFPFVNCILAEDGKQPPPPPDGAAVVIVVVVVVVVVVTAMILFGLITLNKDQIMKQKLCFGPNLVLKLDLRESDTFCK